MWGSSLGRDGLPRRVVMNRHAEEFTTWMMKEKKKAEKKSSNDHHPLASLIKSTPASLITHPRPRRRRLISDDPRMFLSPILPP
jgi:hypothetical protein